MRDYVAWHDAYADSASPLSRRLQVVIELIGEVLDGAPLGVVRFISMCAGQGHDVLGAAATHRRGRDLVGRLVELDEVNAAAASARATELGLTGIEVVAADAGTTDAYEGAVPADLVVACGIFGNVSMEHMERTIRALPGLCAPGARVVWTRHPREAGVLPSIERWFEEAGFEGGTVIIDPGQAFGVGLHRLVGEPAPFVGGRPLFTFIR